MSSAAQQRDLRARHRRLTRQPVDTRNVDVRHHTPRFRRPRLNPPTLTVSSSRTSVGETGSETALATLDTREHP
jgi:hypothetical protein